MFTSYTTGNGIKVVLEKLPHLRSASVGIWFRAGSVYEGPNENGISHFIEHMLFKGTTKRSAKDIAEEIDAVGGQLNAFTAKEYTCFYCKVMDEHIKLGMDLLSDMVLNSVFDERELEKEKGVITEEIYMYEDSPEDLVHDLLAMKFFGDHPLANNILGTPSQIEQFNRDQVLDFYNRYYTPDNMVISVAGNFDEDSLSDMIEMYFGGGWSRQACTAVLHKADKAESAACFRKKEIEQIHICLAFPGIELGKEDIYPLLVLNNIFGGGMSSRLFQKIREDRGLTYSVYSYPSSYLSGGMFTIYAGMNPNQSTEVLKLILDEIGLLRKEGITQKEFAMAREQLKGNYILGLESASSRMTAMGKNKLLLDRVLPPDEIISKINKLTYDDVMSITDTIFGSGLHAATAVGNDDITSLLVDALREGI
ncbi:MAG TPA: pitrilysin family protein [Candidatus Atribacteria bacterium]|nr:pitrilysin family protein [Candidatus Atribacteria bacterium]